MSGDAAQDRAIKNAEAAIDAGDPDKTMDMLSPYFQTGLRPRALWLVARVLTNAGQYSQGLDLFKKAFAQDRLLPFVELPVEGSVLRFRDVPGSLSILDFAEEFNSDIYGLADLDLADGDVFIDVGANVGLVSIAVARRHPGVRVIAFEPAPKTFEALQQNLRENGIGNVTAVNKAINADGRDLELMVMHNDSGASNAFGSAAVTERFQAENIGELVRVEALTLDAAFDAYAVDRCAFLKLDCEGAEHEVLRTTGVLERTDRIAMELHIDLPHLENTTPEAFAASFLAEVRARVAHPPDIAVASIVGVRDT